MLSSTPASFPFTSEASSAAHRAPQHVPVPHQVHPATQPQHVPQQQHMVAVNPAATQRHAGQLPTGNPVAPVQPGPLTARNPGTVFRQESIIGQPNAAAATPAIPANIGHAGPQYGQRLPTVTVSLDEHGRVPRMNFEIYEDEKQAQPLLRRYENTYFAVLTDLIRNNSALNLVRWPRCFDIP